MTTVFEKGRLLGHVRVPGEGVFKILSVGDALVVQELDVERFKQPT